MELCHNKIYNRDKPIYHAEVSKPGTKDHLQHNSGSMRSMDTMSWRVEESLFVSYSLSPVLNTNAHTLKLE